MSKPREGKVPSVLQKTLSFTVKFSARITLIPRRWLPSQTTFSTNTLRQGAQTNRRQRPLFADNVPRHPEKATEHAHGKQNQLHRHSKSVRRFHLRLKLKSPAGGL